MRKYLPLIALVLTGSAHANDPITITKSMNTDDCTHIVGDVTGIYGYEIVKRSGAEQVKLKNRYLAAKAYAEIARDLCITSIQIGTPYDVTSPTINIVNWMFKGE